MANSSPYSAYIKAVEGGRFVTIKLLDEEGEEVSGDWNGLPNYPDFEYTFDITSQEYTIEVSDYIMDTLNPLGSDNTWAEFKALNDAIELVQNGTAAYVITTPNLDSFETKITNKMQGEGFTGWNSMSMGAPGSPGDGQNIYHDSTDGWIIEFTYVNWNDRASLSYIAPGAWEWDGGDDTLVFDLAPIDRTLTHPVGDGREVEYTVTFIPKTEIVVVFDEDVEGEIEINGVAVTELDAETFLMLEDSGDFTIEVTSGLITYEVWRMNVIRNPVTGELEFEGGTRLVGPADMLTTTSLYSAVYEVRVAAK